MKNKKVSIIIPVFKEYNIDHFVAVLQRKVKNFNVEIVVVDGDSSGSTISRLEKYDLKTITSEKGRGTQLKKGAEHSTGDLLLFLHADTELPDNFYSAVTDTCDKISSCGAFSLKIDSGKHLYRIIEFFTNLRAKYLQMPFGDQAIFVKREAYFESGGFLEIPVFEDVDLVRKLKKSGAKIHILKETVTTSSRRWESEGILKATMRNWYLQILYFVFNINPHYLKKFYRSQK
ncbi:TIGR04283 family arsenosugar biosynthesis glycosyltransferase [Flexistipes sp.]|uniref:TIGR04283 family arsenosugar biosynthesis glycosyltransferase n=1 Tax=Flexistipes sp. TaxID=3088135 RepID=UPI002E229EAA|nr:TIGR04283 family arsenosugar biosynthesis glycosyltransferase [Flexistipes sp.]